MNKRTYLSTMILFSVVIALTVGIIFMMVLPCKVLEFKDTKYPVITHVVKAGDILQYHARVTKFKVLQGTVCKTLQNNYIYTYAPIVTEMKVGDIDMVISVQLPTYIEPGTYFLRTVYSYKVNPFRTERYTQDTETFEVMK